LKTCKIRLLAVVSGILAKLSVSARLFDYISVLATSGEESLAQVNRKITYPKHKHLVRAGMVIFVYLLMFTSYQIALHRLLCPWTIGHG
jgi:hypothetical protein